MFAMIKKEFKTYFSSPLGYAVIALLLFFTGAYYNMLFSGGLADMSYIFRSMLTWVFFVIPVITMRLFSEEKKQKTDQLLITAPVNIYSIVIGKFIAALLYFGIYVAITALYNFVFYFFGAQPDMMIYLGNIIGIMLLASLLISIGIFISALTESQVVAAVGSFSVSFLLLFIEDSYSELDSSFIDKICSWISLTDRYYTFTQGIFDIANVVFFVSFTIAFLFLTVRVIDRKRWA